MLDIVKEAADVCGGTAVLAERIGVRPQAMYQWKKVPSKRVVPMEEATDGKVPRERIRPDLYRQSPLAVAGVCI